MNESLLVDYNMIVDTDIGIYKLLQKFYFNSGIFINYMLSIKDDANMLKLMSERLDYNPIKMFLRKEYINECDNIYNSITDNEDNIKYINNNGNVLNTFKLFNTLLNTNLIKITVVCKNEYEKKIIEKLFGNKKMCIIISEFSDINLDNYSAIYIKKFEDVLKFKNLYKKTIYIPSYKFNYDHEEKSDLYNTLIGDKIPRKDICLLIGRENKIEIIKNY